MNYLSPQDTQEIIANTKKPYGIKEYVAGALGAVAGFGLSGHALLSNSLNQEYDTSFAAKVRNAAAEAYEKTNPMPMGATSGWGMSEAYAKWSDGLGKAMDATGYKIRQPAMGALEALKNTSSLNQVIIGLATLGGFALLAYSVNSWRHSYAMQQGFADRVLQQRTATQAAETSRG